MAWLDENSIYSATMRVCLELQQEAAFAAHDQIMYRDLGFMGRAVQEQRLQAQAHREMFDRLERLL